MDLSELEQRLKGLESWQADSQAQAQAAAQEAELNDFMQNYGNLVGGDKSLGSLVLGAMDRNGIDTEAAKTQAVMTVIDNLRNDANMLLDAIGRTSQQQQQAVTETIQQLDNMGQAVSEALAQQGAAGAAGTPMEPAPAEPPAAPVEQPPAEPASAEPAPAEPPAAPVEQPPVEPTSVPEQPAAPQFDPSATLSDMRMKVLHGLKENRPKPAGGNISAGILAACQGGY